MKYDLTAPCHNCPFRKEGGIRLRSSRVKELIRTTQNPGAEFACHKTTKEDDEGDRRATANSHHCAGALVFADKQGTSSQMMRIAERFGGLDWRELKGHEDVFDSSREFIASSIDNSEGALTRRLGVCGIVWDNDCESHNDDEEGEILECWACGDDVCASCSEIRFYIRSKEKVIVCKNCLDSRGDEFSKELPKSNKHTHQWKVTQFGAIPGTRGVSGKGRTGPRKRVCTCGVEQQRDSKKKKWITATK